MLGGCGARAYLTEPSQDPSEPWCHQVSLPDANHPTTQVSNIVPAGRDSALRANILRPSLPFLKCLSTECGSSKIPSAELPTHVGVITHGTGPLVRSKSCVHRSRQQSFRHFQSTAGLPGVVGSPYSLSSPARASPRRGHDQWASSHAGVERGMMLLIERCHMQSRKSPSVMLRRGCKDNRSSCRTP